MTFPVSNAAFRSLLALLVLAVSAQPAVSQTLPDPSKSHFSSDTVLVQFKPGAPASEIAQAHRNANGSRIRMLRDARTQLIKVPAGTARSAVDNYRRNPNTELADLNYTRLLFRPATTEGSEPTLGVANNFTEQWGLNNTGQAFGASLDPLFGTLVYPTYQGASGADINAPEAWALSTGSASVGVAVLDSGIACDHLDLAGKCIEEINYVITQGSTLEDVLGHGTHVAGIAAAATDNGIGIAGVGWKTSVGSLKTCWEDYSLVLYGIVLGQCDDADVIDAIVDATNSPNYQVINMSFAGPDYSAIFESAVNDAWNSGMVLVAGAGNSYSPQVMYPAGYANVIAVGSTDYYDNLSGFSSFGASWVSVLAPGTAIISTVPGEFCGQAAGEPSDCYDYKSGTSMSTPHVAGLAALLVAHNASATNAEIRGLIENTADTAGALGQDFTAWAEYGRINMSAALGSNTQATTHHVQSIVVGTVNAGRGNKNGQAVVTIVDNFGNPVNGATVSGTFSGDYSESHSGTTSGNGDVTLTTTATAKGGVAFTFCVSDVTRPPGTTVYDSNSNVLSCNSL